MKKLNKKGFTLIELLAVIVILAIIVVVTVPTILNSINDARLSSLHSLAKEVANQYDTLLAQDQLATGSNKVLGDAVVPDDGIWYCLKNVKNSDNSLFEIFDLSEDDIYTGYKNGDDYGGTISGELYVFDLNGKASFDPSPDDGDDICSAIRLVNGRAEVYLVAKANGKFDTNGSSWAYALSSGASAFDTINE